MVVSGVGWANKYVGSDGGDMVRIEIEYGVGMRIGDGVGGGVGREERVWWWC